MSGLWRKELRSVLPFLALVVFVTGMGVVYEGLTDPPNMIPLAESYEDYVVSSKEGTIMIFLITFAMASGLLVREYDEGTLEFLDSLPVSRSRVFMVKLATALLVLLLLVLLDVGTSVVLHALSRTSLDRSFHVPVLATAVVLRACQLYVVLSLGVALSFLRRFGWLVAGLLFWAYILLHERVPQIAVFDLFALNEPHFEGQRWTVPHRQLAVQLSLAAVLTALAYGLFLGWGDRLMRGFRQLTQSRLGNAFLLGGSIVLAIIAFSLVFRHMEGEYGDAEPTDESGVTAVYPSWSTSRARTEHYEFVYPTNLAGRAGRLVERADSVHETVRSYFDAPPGEVIVVDAASLLPRHLGVAYWDKIRLDLSASEDLPTLESILGHETTHIYLDRLSDSRLTEQFNSTRFFHEGVASYVEYHLFQPEQDLDTLLSVAAVMRARQEVDFRELVDSQRLSARRDSNLVYPLGEVFVEALVARYGGESIGTIVRALVRDDAPEGLAGLDLWRDVFQACGYNLDDVLDEFFARLDEQVVRHRALIDTLPRLRGAVEWDEYFVYVRVLGDSVDGWHPVCRFRQAADTPDRQYLQGDRDEEGVFYQWREFFPGATVWYQLGLSDGEARVIYEPWLQVRVGG